MGKMKKQQAGSNVSAAAPKTSATTSSPPPHDGNDQYEEIFSTGRSCRDIFCTVLFMAYVGGCVYLAMYAYQKDADPRRLVSGYDKFGNTCGRTNKPIQGAIYSGADTTGMMYHYTEEGFSICVSKCPDIDIDTKDDLLTLFDQDIKMCLYSVSRSDYDLDGGILCAKSGSKATHPFLLDCTSVPVGQAVDAQIALALEFGQKLAADIYLSRNVIITCTLMAIPICFVWLCLLNIFAPVFIYTVLIAMFIGSIGSSTFMWSAYQGKIYIREAAETHRNVWLAGTIGVTIVTALVCLIILAMLKRVKIALAMFNEANKFIRQVPCITIQPVFSIIYFLVSGALITLLILALMTPHVVEVGPNNIDVTYRTDQTYYLWLIAAFLLFWVYQLTHDSTEFIIAGTVSQWYFSRDKSNLGWITTRSIYNLLRFQFGSILFGSVLIALIKFVRAIIFYIAQKLESAKLNFVKCMLNCVQCFLACFEKTIKFITRNAYIEMSISGKGFIPAAKKSFKFMVSHALSLATVNIITFVLLWFCKIYVALSVAAGAFYWQKNHKTENEFNYTFSAALISGTLALMISHMFMEVFDMTIDTIFYCFCKDKDYNKGRSEKAYFMSKDLMRLVHVRKHSLAK